MATQPHASGGPKSSMVITKEFLVGLLAIVIGAYNLYYNYTGKTFLGSVSIIKFTQPVANVILVIAGLILWITAYKLWRFKWHSRGLF